MSNIIREKFLDPTLGMVATTKNYDEMASQYNKIASGDNYRGPVRAVETLVKLIDGRTRSDMKIMDMGCGTGLVGEKLQAAGFTNIDGIDPSQGMLDVARSKGIYKELFCAYVALNDERLPIPNNSYDALTIVGSMGTNMVPSEGILEMQRLVKPGGYVINVVRQETIYETEGFKDKLEPMMQQLEADCKWNLVSRELFPDYCDGVGGVIFTHQVC